MTTTAFPQLVDNIITALKAAPALEGVRVFDGIEIDNSYPEDFIAIGHDGSDDDDVQANSLRNSWDSVGAKRMFEDGAINCFISSWNGSTDVRARRQRAYEILSEIDTVIRQDPSFSGVCLYAGLESHSANYQQTEQGAAVMITFTIVYRART